MELKHNDCLNFCAIDAAKGICRLTKQHIAIDDPACSSLVKAPKCKNCMNFKDSGADGIGQCTGLEIDNWTYATLNAVTCKGHTFNG